MTPKLANKAFSAKSTQIIRLECHKEPCNTEKMDSQTRYVAASVITDRQTDTQNDYRNPTAHAPRVNHKNVAYMYMYSVGWVLFVNTSLNVICKGCRNKLTQ